MPTLFRYPIDLLLPTPELSALFDMDPPPSQLYVLGKSQSHALLYQLPERGLAVVGTRHPQPRSEALVEKVIRDLQQSGLIILSGLARGIDSRAHKSALEAGLPTIAILGGGFQALYPRENLPLAETILENGGLLISEFPPKTSARAGFFIQRNRLIAHWAKAVWVVEATFRSGALNTAKWARKSSRQTYATACYPDDPALAGNQGLLTDHGAHPVWGAASFSQTWLDLASAGRTNTPANSGKIPGKDAEKLQQEILRHSTVRGGIPLTELLSRYLSNGWSPTRFFEAIESGLTAKLFSDDRGSLVTLEKIKEKNFFTTSALEK